MGFDDKIGNKAQETSGKVKEGVGEATDNPGLTQDGKNDKAEAGFKQAGEKVKDAAQDLKDGLK